MPASTSSKTMHSAEFFAAAATWIARLMRDSSPPEATLAMLLGGWPGLALPRNSTSSLPCAPNSRSLGRLARLGAHKESDPLAAVRADSVLAGSQAHPEAPARHAERLHELRD